jgi:hypothetical protein
MEYNNKEAPDMQICVVEVAKYKQCGILTKGAKDNSYIQQMSMICKEYDE